MLPKIDGLSGICGLLARVHALPKVNRRLSQICRWLSKLDSWSRRVHALPWIT